MYCPRCRNEVSDEATYCKTCGMKLKEPRIGDEIAISVGATEHLSTAFKIATEKPMVFAPALIGGLISLIISYLWSPTSSFGLSEFGKEACHFTAGC